MQEVLEKVSTATAKIGLLFLFANVIAKMLILFKTS